MLPSLTPEQQSYVLDTMERLLRPGVDPGLLFIGIVDQPVFHWSANGPHPFQVTGNGSIDFLLGIKTRFWGPAKEQRSGQGHLPWKGSANLPGEDWI